MNGKRARQIRKFLKMKKRKDNDKYEHIISKENDVLNVHYKIKKLTEEGIEADKETSIGDKLTMVNADKIETMYKLIKKDYYDHKKEILGGLNYSKEDNNE